jgi:Family of unknown function (DUF5317)
MIGLLFPSLLATLSGLVAGGSLAGWRRVHLAWWPLLVGAFLVELVLYDPPLNQQPWALEFGPWVWVLARLVMLAVCLRNARTPGGWSTAWLIVALGLSLNGAVIVANAGHMPQSPSAAALVWGDAYVQPERYVGQLENVVWMTPKTPLAWLGDILPEPRWFPHANVMSIGDVLLALGMAAWAFNVTRATQDALPRPGRPWSPQTSDCLSWSAPSLERERRPR